MIFEGGVGHTDDTEIQTQPMSVVSRRGRNLERMAGTKAVATIFHNPH